ncbi:hypothetical protein [Candidatus Protochlamydia phocaeensis]|uniref:hypothetical protein n=1 Tax=Candidatus Protochlamydia phocaeensis TaxID=1414722 RepID=UPI0008396AFE|nr:hypothetical protein [Candidatus Protochlamydia phocaeensis]
MNAYPIDLPFYSSHYDLGVSSPSQEVSTYIWRIRNHTSQTMSLGWRETLNQQLMDVYSRCCEENWDGYDAVAINRSAIYATSIFIELLPDGIKIPEIVPEPTGEIGFEWTNGKHAIFAVSVNSQTITFAGLFGSGKSHGEVKFLNVIPSIIEKILLDYFVLS